ncbi:16S rRNA (uracil(1498)-N(3))-methyltransferase [Halobacillus sp. A5]|uniref:16S rRNA (uracil(1498)-N(3))-methyltransferase n=1 Tax=Halobacillus sp. A5 TaxID=2880263 RepID=UPI0020A6B19B|nr:16S rRNA (uracil(1498)-N(3))-methyltransferase [Halobacillus sp. A5]
MQRYFVDSSNWTQSCVFINNEDVHHIVNVMRMNVGDQLIVVHAVKGDAVCTITSIDKSCVEMEISDWVPKNNELPVEVTIVQSLGKGDKMEQVVQKGTELGASFFIPFQAARSVTKWDSKKTDKKISRLKKIAKEASEQSERTRIPSVQSVIKLNDLIGLNEYDHKLIAYEKEARREYSSTLHRSLATVNPGDSVIIVFGPEGGFSEQEGAALIEKGFCSVRLGPRILRMETAPLYFLSALSYQLEEA